MPGLTQEQVDTFHREGLLCVENFLSPEETSVLRNRAQQLLDNFDVETHPKTKFKTDEDDHIGDQYFFESSDKVRFFFDVDAFDESGALTRPKQRAVNKLGHGLHLHEKVFRDVTFGPGVQNVARALEYKDPRVLQSMCIFKQPDEKGGERKNAVPPHTDGWFLYTEPQSALGFWFALEDCTTSNGCLSYHPGSHKTFPIKKRFVKVDKGEKGCNFIPVDADKRETPEDSPEAYKTVECKAGALVLIHNSVLHKSENNRSDKSRFVYAFHLIDGVAKYDALNWLQVPPGPEGGTEFSKLYGEDT